MAQSDFYKKLLSLEANHQPEPSYLVTLNHELRACCVNWMLDLMKIIDMPSEGFFVCVRLFDRFMSLRGLKSGPSLRVYATVAVWCASKLEQDDYCGAESLVDYSHKKFTKMELIATEIAMMSALKYQVNCPTAYVFYTHWQEMFISGTKVSPDCQEQIFAIAEYYLRLSLVESRFLRFRPSMVAAAALFQGMLCNDTAWDAVLVTNTTYRPEDLGECCKEFENVTQL